MKESKFNEEQIIKILRQAATGEQTIAAVCREHAVAENTFYKWRQKYGGMEVSEARRLRELEKRGYQMNCVNEFPSSEGTRPSKMIEKAFIA